MSITIGNNDLKHFSIGSQEGKAIYIGEELIWPIGSDVNEPNFNGIFNRTMSRESGEPEHSIEIFYRIVDVDTNEIIRNVGFSYQNNTSNCNAVTTDSENLLEPALIGNFRIIIVPRFLDQFGLIPFIKESEISVSFKRLQNNPIIIFEDTEILSEGTNNIFSVNNEGIGDNEFGYVIEYENKFNSILELEVSFKTCNF